MTCIAIIESSKRASESEHKEKLVTFIEDQTKAVLHQLNILPTNEMYNWKGDEWIQNINNKNPRITDEIIDEFEVLLNDFFTEYAIYVDFIAGHEIYELCGVYWRLNRELHELVGPTIDKTKIYDYFG